MVFLGALLVGVVTILVCLGLMVVVLYLFERLGS